MKAVLCCRVHEVSEDGASARLRLLGWAKEPDRTDGKGGMTPIGFDMWLPIIPANGLGLFPGLYLELTIEHSADEPVPAA